MKDDEPFDILIKSNTGTYNPYSFRSVLPTLDLEKVELVEEYKDGYVAKLKEITQYEISRIIFLHEHDLTRL